MRFTKKENPEQVRQYGHIKPAPVFGPLRCLDRCPGTHLTCTLSKGHSGPHVAHGFFKEVTAVWDEVEHDNPANVLRSSRSCKSIPTDLLDALGQRLTSTIQATEFAELCESSGILAKNMSPLAQLTPDDPDFFVGNVAITLTSYANAMGDKRQFARAKQALTFALCLQPRHLPAWSSMALVALATNDYKTALSWADKYLTYKLDPNSSDLWDQVEADAMGSEGERFAAEALEDPDLLGAEKQVRETMRMVKKACKSAER